MSPPEAAAAPALPAAAAAPLLLGERAAEQGRRGFAVPAHERIVLANGFTLIVVPRREVPLVAFQLLLRGGALGDPPGKAGVASLTAGLLDKGAGERDAAAFAEAVEDVGGTFTAAATAESICVSGQFLARNQELMLELIADAVMAPRFGAAEFTRLRARQTGHIRAMKDSDPAELLPVYGRAFLFGGHPYGAPVTGSEDSLTGITLEDVRGYHRDHIGADRAALIIAGDVDVSWLESAARQMFGAWRRSAEPLPAVPPTPRANSPGVLLVDAPGSAQSYFWLGATGVERTYPDRAALDLVNTLFGGRFTSLLNTELRIRTGLSYGAGSSFTRARAAGEFCIRSFTETEHTVTALDLALHTLGRLKQQGITQAMLDSARAYVTGQYPLTLETAADWVGAFAELELYGLPPDYIEGYVPALRGARLTDAARVIAGAFPEPQQLAIVLIGDAARIGWQLHKYGPQRLVTLAARDFGRPSPSARG